MYLQYTSSKDTYITNKILTWTSKATDANVGRASTLDLFKLYNENNYSGSSAPIETSRILIGFHTDDISSSLSGKTSFDDSSFKCTLNLHDIQGSSVAPSDFNIIVYPMSRSFDEGIGSDISSFNDLDRANWVTASLANGSNVLWDTAGAASEGRLNVTADIDIIGSGTLNGSLQYLYKTHVCFIDIL